MKYVKSTLLVLIPALLVLVCPSLLAADTTTPATPEAGAVQLQDEPVDESAMPLSEGGVPYQFPIIASDPPVDLPAAPDALTINVWYGLDQTFDKGTPQEWINILGTITSDNPLQSLTYKLNGGSSRPLNWGPDTQRLYRQGDFNIELHYSELKQMPESNTVAISAFDGTTMQTANVTVRYDGSAQWPLPYEVDWSTTSNVTDAVQVVDGQWEITPAGELHNIYPGYDRLVNFGQMSWSDYVVTVPVRVASLNSAEWGSPSNGAGVGFIVRWLGHTEIVPGEQPLEGWRRLGALAWHKWNPNGSAGLEMRGNRGGWIVPLTTQQIQLNTQYIFKLSVVTSTLEGEGARYRFKYWPANQPEPPTWNMTAIGDAQEPATGSILLVAHQADVYFGDILVEPIDPGPFTINVQPTTNGSIIVDPVKPSYSYGEQVSIRALGDTNGVSHYKLSAWQGSLTGSQNPVVFDIAQNITVGATFAAAPAPTLTVNQPTGGTVVVEPQKNVYQYGEQVSLTPLPDSGYLFAGWGNDLSGIANPAILTIQQASTTVSANFQLANLDSPTSDDFSGCVIDEDLWTEIDPEGDSVFSLAGPRLQIAVPAGNSHNVWLEGNRSARIMQETENDDLQIEAKFDSAVTKKYQMQGMIVEENGSNFLRFEVHHDGNETRLFAARFTNGRPYSIVNKPISATPAYLRVSRIGNLWSFTYSYNRQLWFQGVDFGHNLAVNRTGVFAGNHSKVAGQEPAHTAIVDYFFNNAAPIVPEDGGSQNTISVQNLGQGAVNISPNKPNYQCGEQVTLTAIPANGWRFDSWSGDITGINPVAQLTVTGSYNITANFTQGTESKLYLPLILRN